MHLRRLAGQMRVRKGDSCPALRGRTAPRVRVRVGPGSMERGLSRQPQSPSRKVLFYPVPQDLAVFVLNVIALKDHAWVMFTARLPGLKSRPAEPLRSFEDLHRRQVICDPNALTENEPDIRTG